MGAAVVRANANPVAPRATSTTAGMMYTNGDGSSSVATAGDEIGFSWSAEYGDCWTGIGATLAGRGPGRRGAWLSGLRRSCGGTFGRAWYTAPGRVSAPRRSWRGADVVPARLDVWTPSLSIGYRGAGRGGGDGEREEGRGDDAGGGGGHGRQRPRRR